MSPIHVVVRCRGRSMQVLKEPKETRESLKMLHLIEETEAHIFVGLLLLCGAS